MKTNFKSGDKVFLKDHIPDFSKMSSGYINSLKIQKSMMSLMGQEVTIKEVHQLRASGENYGYIINECPYHWFHEDLFEECGAPVQFNLNEYEKLMDF